MYRLFPSSEIRTLDVQRKYTSKFRSQNTRSIGTVKVSKFRNQNTGQSSKVRTRDQNRHYTKKRQNQKHFKVPILAHPIKRDIKKKQIFQSEDESQQIAVWWLLYYVQHPDQYLGRLRTIWHLRITPRRFGLRAGDAQSRRPLGCSESNRPRRQSSLPRTRQMYAPAKLAHRCARCERYRCSDQTGF